MGVFDSVRRARIDGDPVDPGRPVNPRVVTVAPPDRFQISAFVSLGKGYIPDQVYLGSAGAPVHEQELHITKKHNPKRRPAPF